MNKDFGRHGRYSRVNDDEGKHFQSCPLSRFLINDAQRSKQVPQYVGEQNKLDDKRYRQCVRGFFERQYEPGKDEEDSVSMQRINKMLEVEPVSIQHLQ